MSEPFDPTRHLTKVSGKDYLEVKWRLVWLRDVHPLAQIETELVQDRENRAIFRAKVTLPPSHYDLINPSTGEIQPGHFSASATGWGSEASGDFGDYLEKAETKAIGRALAALGFGTQFTGTELEEGARIVDSPVGSAVRYGPTQTPLNANQPNAKPTVTRTPPAQQGSSPPQGQRAYPTVNQLKIARPKASAAGLNWDTQANDIIFAATGIATNTGTVPRNDTFQEVMLWLDKYEGSMADVWVYDSNGHLVFGPDVGVPPVEHTQPTDPDYPDLDDVPF